MSLQPETCKDKHRERCFSAVPNAFGRARVVWVLLNEKGESGKHKSNGNEASMVQFATHCQIFSALQTREVLMKCLVEHYTTRVSAKELLCRDVNEVSITVGHFPSSSCSSSDAIRIVRCEG